MLLPVNRTTDNAVIPARHSVGAAGLDLYADLEQQVLLREGDTVTIPTGIRVAIPPGYAGLVVERSSLHNRGLRLANSVGLIDSDYRGEIKLKIHRYFVVGSQSYTVIGNGDRLAQLVIVACPTPTAYEVASLSSTERGSGGFGSTGK